MPIDLTRSSAEKSSSSSRSSFATSNSLYSFHQQHKVGSGSSGGTSFSLSSSHHPISSSKSSNCLSDTLIEDEALIEKLFPKCRPKSSKTTTTTSSSSAKSSTERTNGGTAPASAVAASYQQKNSVEMLNKADQGGQEGPPLPSQPPSQMPPSAAVRKGGAVRKSGFNACHPPTYHHNSNVPSRRLWNFMDISPSPSPPPLSPVEPVDCPGGAQRYEHHDQPLQCEAAQYTGTSQERPSPVGEQYQSATSTTSGYDGSSSSSNCRDHFKSTTKGGRFDINSLELNRVAPQEKNASTNAFKGDHRYYGDVPPMEKVPSARSASQSHSKHAAHFRLDSLLLSPDDPQPYKAPNSKSQQQQQLSNGIKKSNRFTLDVDDEDDVLFSRFHHHSSNGQPRPAASSTAAAIPASSKNFLKDSSNSYLIDSHRSSRERSAEATVMPTTVMSAGSRRETSVESMRSSRARALREELVDACARELVSKLPPQASSGPVATTMTAAVASSHCRMVKEDVGSNSDNEDDDDDNGGFKAAGTTTNTATTATTTSNISTGARNRIELAGGRELFSSSRSMRSKRRSSNHAATSGHGQSAKTNAELQQQQQHHQQPYQASSQATTGSSRRSGSNSSFISRHTQLYSVSMATEGGANEAAPTSQHSELSSSVAGESTAAAAAAVVVDEELPSEGRLLHSEKQTQQTQSQQQTQLQQQQPQQPPPPPQLVNTLESPVVTADKNQRSNAGGACNTNNDQRTLPVESSTSTAAAMSAAQHCHRMPGEAAAVVSEEQLLETTTSAMTDPEDSRVVNAVPPVGLDEEEVVSSSNQEEEPVDVDSEDSNSSCGTSAKSFEGAASSPSHDERIARIIGSVPIAQYEGSPKRYGPKPGYPKRVLSTSSNNSCSNEFEPSILMMPNKKADTLLPADNDEEHRQHQRHREEQDQLEQHKTKLVNLSLSENGSPHSSTHSSTSSATFSSTDIHSSSSFSCPSNAHHHHQHQHQHHPLPKSSSTSHHHHFGTSKWANEAVGGGGCNNNNNIANNSNYDCRSNDEHCFSADCGGGNRTLDQSAIDTCDEGCGVAVAPSTRKVVAESNFPATEEIVKTILSLPSGQIDTEDDVDEDVTESSSDKATAGEEMLPPAIGAMIHSSSNSRTAAEPMYSSIASSGGYSAVDANKSSGYSSKRSLHSDDSESVTKSKTSISGSSGHGDRGSSLNRSSTSLKQQQSLSEANRSIGSQSTLDGSSVKQLNSAAQLASESASRNVPKSLRLEREGVVGSSSYHPHGQTRYHLEPSQSFESTDSSYRSSEQCPNSKDYYYGQSDDDLYLYGPSSKTSSGCYPGKAVAGGPTDRLTHSADRAIASGGSGNLNGGGSEFQEGTQSTKGTMMPPGGQRTSTQVPHLSYTALSPELSTSGLGGVGGDGGSKFYGVLDSTYESTGDYPSDNNTESYESETAGKSGCDGGGATGDGGRIKVMPILEDGLSSGMPSSDELEYDEDDEGEDEMVAHEHDLDEYVNEYHSNNSRSNQCEPTSMMQSQPPPSTTTSTTGSYGNATSSTLRLDQMVNGTASGGGSANYNYGHSYGKQVPPPGGDYARPHKSSDGQMYRCGKGSYGLEMAGEMMTKTKEVSHDFYNGHHHHSNHHLHNHPVLDELTTGAATRSISNSSSNNSSMSTVRNSQLGPSSSSTGGKQQQQQHHHQSSSSSSPPPPPAPGGGSSHHHYHHYYHQSSAGAGSASASAAAASLGRQNYPNLSSSPTSLSPNSPGGRAGVGSAGPAVDGSGGLHHQQSSASSSSSSSHPSASQATAQKQQQQQSSAGGQHHYHQTAGSSAGAVSTVSAAAGSSSTTATAAAASGVQQSPAEMASAVGTSTSPSSSHAATGGMLPPPNVRHHHDEDCDTDQETDRLLGSQRNDDRGFYDEKFRKSSVPPPEEDVAAQLKRSSTSREVLIEGVLFRARYLGSTQLVCDGQPTKATRMMQAEEAVSRIKSLAPEGENQPSTEVDLFISTEKIMVLNTDLKEIMMDHALRTISYIADIGDLLVLMARRRTPIDDPNDNGIKRIPKMICHVFESEEAQYIAQSIGQAFQVAYMEFLKANGIEDSSFLKEMDYQEVLNSQEIFGNELEMFAKRERQKEVIVPKQKGEILGIVIVESGWGSMLPTVVIANMAQSSPSARCGQLNIGDQIIAINGISLVGLPLSTCQAYVKNTKNQTAVKFTIVPCAPVVEVKIKRPDTKYQLGFSVQNGVICSLLRGGIAERGGVRVGHRIIEINGQSVVAVPHDRIVNLLATSVGEIHMKTMPTSMFRLLTGQDSPSYM